MHTTLTNSLWRTTANRAAPWFASARRTRRNERHERSRPAGRPANPENARWPVRPSPVALDA